MTSRKKDNRTLKRKPASVVSTTVDEHDEHDDPIPKKVLKKAGRAAVVVERLQDTSSTRKVSSAGGATPSKSSGRGGSGSSSSKRRKKKEPTPKPSSSSSSDDEEDVYEEENEDEEEEDKDQKEEQENGSDNEQEEEEAESSSSRSEDEEEKRREEERRRKEKQKKRKSARDESKHHKSSSGSGSSSSKKHKEREREKDEERHVKEREKSKDKDKSDKCSSSSGSSSSSSKPVVSSTPHHSPVKSTSNKPPTKPQVTPAVSEETKLAADALIAISKQQQQQQQQHCDSFNIGDLEDEVLDYEDSEDVHTQTPSPVPSEPIFDKLTKKSTKSSQEDREPGSPVPDHVDDTGMEVDDDQPAEEQNGDDAADDAADGDGADNDAEGDDDGNESDGTDVLDESSCEKKPSDENKLPLKRQDGITMMSPLHTRSGKSIGVTSSQVPPAVVAAEKDDKKQQEVVVVTADVHRSGSVSPPQQREKSSNSSHIVVEETSYEKYSKETYSNNWERWCYARLPGGKAMLYEVDGTHLHGKIPSVLDMHVIDTDSSVAYKLKDYKQNFYNASKEWVKLLMTSLRELSECDLDIIDHQLFSITYVSDPRHVFYGRAMGSDETVFSIIEDVFNDIGVNEKIHADVSLHEFPQCVDLVHFEQDRSSDEKTDNRIKKLADDNNSDALIAGILGHLCQSINVDKQITKKQYESTISYCDGLFVLPVKYQGYIFPGVDMYGYSDPLSRMSASFDLNECNPLAIEVLILLESLLMVHNCLYPIMNYDEKWIQLTTHCYNDLQTLQQESVRAPSSIDYQCRMMNLLDEVIEFEHSLTKDNGSSRQDRRVKQAFNLLVDLYCMNRIMTLSYSHEARCVRGKNLLTQDRDMVVYNILVKFLTFEERVKKVYVKDSGLQSLLLQWSGAGGANGDSKAARGGGKQQTVQQLRLKLPSYFTDVILKHFMSQ